MFLRNSLLFILLSLLPLACAQVPASPSRSASSNSGAGSTLDLSAFAENPSRWKLLSDLDGIRIYQDQQRIPGRIGLRGKLNANAGIAKVATVFTDLEMRKKWVLGLIEDRILSTRSDFERVEYAKLKSDWPYPFIDFIYQMTFSVLREPKTLLIRMASTTDNSVPIPTDTVRGTVTNSYDFVKEVDADHSEIILEIGLDPKGALPSWDSQAKVVLWFGELMQRLKATVEDPQVKVSVAVERYIAKYKL